jgi:L-ascorbate metabolism protein UlaG (beta-lactamase superfamily)
MSKVRISYYGHSCFKVESSSGSIIFDPYNDCSVPGLQLPRGLQADVVSCSHQHADHNAADLVSLTGKEPAFKVRKLTMPHDHHNGAHRGMSDITMVNFDGLTVCHLGDLGRLPTGKEYAFFDQADVVLLPCAGYFTITSEEAQTVIDHLKHPCLKILMHFREGERGYEVQETIDEVAADVSFIHRLADTTITVDADAVPDEIITLEPEQ